MSDIDSQSGGSADSAENVDGIDDNEWDWGADEQQASTRCAAKPCQYSPPWGFYTVACPVARMRVAFFKVVRVLTFVFVLHRQGHFKPRG